MTTINWNDKAKQVFEEITGNLPQFHRSIAQKLVKQSAEEISSTRGSDCVEEKDLIQAFFKEVPPAFKEMMKRMFAQHNIDYAQYIDEESN